MTGVDVTLYEGMPSVGRKFLVAGHGGLNLTHSDPLEKFSERYEGSFQSGYWTSLLGDFSNQATRDWAAGLGIETFIGTSGRVFPKEFKAAPLLRSWVRRLRAEEVTIKTRHHLRLITVKDGHFVLSFSTTEGALTTDHDAVILALGGASWPETGSDARWVSLLGDMGLPITPFSPVNCGWEVNWGLILNQYTLFSIEGHPLKNITVSAGEKSTAGELLITKYGLEGGALYHLGSALRRMQKPVIRIDLKPSFSSEELASRVASNPKDLITAAAKAWRLSPAAKALLDSIASGETNPLSLAELTKNLPIALSGPRPITEAISSAGGVSFESLNENLMVKSLPGLFLAGEMLDWEAPTGGYLLQGCLATGTRAAFGALKYLSESQGFMAVSCI